MKKRVVFTQGGKGGVGKTTFANDLADWYRAKRVKVKLYDFDYENKTASSFQFFNPEAEKFNINEEGSLDVILSALTTDDYDVVLIDQAAASGEATFDWFEEMGETALGMGIGFTSVGLVTADPGSVESVVSWISSLDDQADHLVVKNKMSNKREAFSSWQKNVGAIELRKNFEIIEIVMEKRLGEFEELIRESGHTLAQVADLKKGALSDIKWRARAKGYHLKATAALNSVSSILLVNNAE